MKRIAVFFPGIGYHKDKPLLYYSRDIVVECGYEKCINVEYSHTGENIRGNLDKMKEAFASLYDQADKLLADVNWDEYDDILFVSKSIGTIIASEYVSKKNIKNVRHILYTPLTFTFMHEPKNAIAFIGTKDAWCNAEDVIAMSNERSIPIHIYEDCNHSLECGDTLKNLEIISDVMNRTKEFI